MDISKIIKKSFDLTWRYRALWLFGFLLALTVSNALWFGFSGNDRPMVVNNRILLTNGNTLYFPGEGVVLDLRTPGAPEVIIEGLGPDWYQDLRREAWLGDLWGLLATIFIMAILFGLLAVVFRYTSLAALIRMVDENERRGVMVKLGKGFRLGWSRVAWKLFLIDLCIALPVFLGFAIVFTLAISPLFLLGVPAISDNLVALINIGFFSAIGLAIFTILAILVGLLLSVLRQVMYQAAGVDGLGVWASIRQGFHLLGTSFSKVIVTWLVWLAVRLGWTFLAIPATILLTPVLILSFLIGVLVAVVPFLLSAWIASLFVSQLFAWIIGAVVGLPLLFLVTLAPLTFLSGLVETFKSSFWTLSYREFRPLPSSPKDQGEIQ